jgi:triacylglycerol lipase
VSTRHLVDPELLDALDAFPPMQFSPELLPALREDMKAMFASTGPAPADVMRTEKRIPGAPGDPDVRVLIYTPAKAETSRPALLNIHGGGYVIGAADMNDDRNYNFVQELGCVVVSVDYRLAPETAHPGPVEDCYAALKWLHGHAAELGIDTGRIAIGGESAGGGLTAGLALLARDRGEVPVAFQLLLYPMIDDRTESHPHAGEFVWTSGHNRFGWASLLGRPPGGGDVSPYAAAARAADLAGLPPSFICVGALDLFVEENLEYARRLMRAGVPTELHVYPGVFHGFERAPEARVTRAAQRDYIEALRQAFRRPAVARAAA